MKIIISGGGTGGHIFPALSIADEIKRRYADADILFIGARNRMEMERVPKAGYKIIGLPVSGFNRQKILKNISTVVGLIKSLLLAGKHIRRFKPDVVIGVGGYASGPTLFMASLLGVPTLLQEQNSYAGMTNKMLAKRAKKICVAYSGMERFFPADRIVLTGNPVRKELETTHEKTADALSYFRLEADKPVLLAVGGSLGARTINNGVLKSLKTMTDAGVQIIWQTGSYYYETIKKEMGDVEYKGLWYDKFITRMDYAYAVADVVVSRAGAASISELTLQKKPSILVPSPNVAEDHQTHNAVALSDRDAAILLPDAAAEDGLASAVLSLLNDKARLQTLSSNIYTFAQHHSAERIVDEVEKK
ncbi:MAG: undecaprenyldiphospho-muramoylpentapeptide beta-N-acetylglucosaminyltransferase [Tannerella sp.]|jgi:UDP-N-acetylglucosamine--N-acetylmuramyl-(pentapeptide) pyrophosphoryl-undecaprenol N-acetylglucosamine transferase|nr:undecaprenyldiphospho-muramoylpentapeptide beta-N-acetylglucosaminyltransferase [Tannerella sp.]